MVGPANPYVGPRPFEPGTPLFGRDREVAELRSLLTSERIVLLYSPSGAGKSSLVKAGLIPQLQRRFDIWGPTRVNQTPPPGVRNRYVWSTIAGLERSDNVVETTLKQYVAQRPRERNPLLIVDQFEEVLRVDPVDIDVKRDYFLQLGETLRDPLIWALLILREDFLAPLDPFARLVPTYLQKRYRLDRLRRDMAAQAIEGPTRTGTRKYAPGVVESLVNNLARVKVQRADGVIDENVIGEYVEPLQLQVVCLDIWDRMKADDLSIDPEDLGDISQALSNYYSSSLRRASGGDEGVERRIRDWFDTQLITGDGVRNQVRQEARATGGLDNALVSKVLDTYLVRAEPRGGSTWLELAHDRLVGPVRSNNAKWFADHLNKVQQRAVQWQRENEAPGLLLCDADLKAAQAWAATAQPTPLEARFLAACEEGQKRVEERRQQERRLAWWTRVATAVSVVAVIAAIAGWIFYKRADDETTRANAAATLALSQEERALQSEEKAKQDTCTAELAQKEAELAQKEAEAAQKEEEKQRQLADWEARRSLSRQLAKSSEENLMVDPQRALLLALHAVANEPSPTSFNSLRAAVVARRQFRFPMTDSVLTVAYDAGRKAIVAVDARGEIRRVSTTTFQMLPPAFERPARLLRAAVSGNGEVVAGIDQEFRVYVWDGKTGKVRRTFRVAHTQEVQSLALDTTGSWLATGAEDGFFKLWEIATGQELRQAQWKAPPTSMRYGEPEQVRSVAYDIVRNRFLGVAETGSGMWWDMRARRRETIRDSAWKGPFDTKSVAVSQKGNEMGEVTWTYGAGSGVMKQAGGFEIRAHEFDVTALAFGDEWYASAGLDGVVRLWRASNGAPDRVLLRHDKPVKALTWTPDGHDVVVGTAGAEVLLVSLDRQPELRTIEGAHSSFRNANNYSGVMDLTFSPTGQQLITVGVDGLTRVWDWEKPDPRPLMEKRQPQNGQLDVAAGVAYHPRLPLVATASWNATVVVRDANTGKDVRRMDLPWVGHLTRYSPQGDLLVSTNAGTIFWRAQADGQAGLAAASIEMTDGWGKADFGPDGEWIATLRDEKFGSQRTHVSLWRKGNSGPPQRVWEDALPRATFMQFSPTGRQLAVSTDDKEIRLYELNGESRQAEFLRISDWVNGFRYSPDGKTIATASKANTVNLWNAHTGELVARLPGHEIGINLVAFSPDGKRIASAGQDGRVQLYTLDPLELLRVAKERLQASVPERRLTPDECRRYLFQESCPGNDEVYRLALERIEANRPPPGASPQAPAYPR
jgi:WD40 repeat protein